MNVHDWAKCSIVLWYIRLQWCFPWHKVSKHIPLFMYGVSKNMTFYSSLGKDEIMLRLYSFTRPNFIAFDNVIVLTKISNNLFSLYYQEAELFQYRRRKRNLPSRLILSPFVFWISIREKECKSIIRGFFFWNIETISFTIISIILMICSFRYDLTPLELINHILGVIFLVSIPVLISLITNFFGKDYIDDRQRVLYFIQDYLLY